MEKIINNIHIKKIGYFNLYLIKGNGGDILIDTGFICMKKILKKWLDKHNVKLIILTHSHIDHIWNVAYLKKIYNCEVAIGKKDLKFIDNSIINSKPLNKKCVLWTNILNKCMKHLVAKPFQVDYLLKDKDQINKYGLTIKIHHLPGHTKGGIGIYYKDYLFAGDALVNRFKVTPAYQNQCPSLVPKSISKIKKLKPAITFIGHDKEIPLDKLLEDLK